MGESSAGDGEVTSLTKASRGTHSVVVVVSAAESLTVALGKNFAVFSLFFLPLSFFLSLFLSVLFTLSFLLLSCRELFPLLIFPFPGSLSLGAYYSLTMGFPP